MNYEYFVVYVYMVMVVYCDKELYEGFVNFFI